MNNCRQMLLILIVLFSAITLVLADGKNLNCQPTGDIMAKRIKQTLAPSYQGNDSKPLVETLNSLDYMLEEAGYCAATARAGGVSGKDRQRFIMEWHSMNQWLSRLSGFMALNVNGDFSRDWKEEYELFLEVYEIAP